jgi:two-component system, cell cycle sensor histidine kinase and response regulator CckA
MKKPLRILIVEDSENDAMLIADHILNNGYEVKWERVETAETMKAAIEERTWDLILSDYNMPRFSGPKALSLLKETGLDIPFIIISGTIGEDTAVEAMQAGANDYLMKGNLTRLVPSIEKELRETIEHANHRHSMQQLILMDFALNNVREMVFLVSENSRFTYVNDATCRELGYTRTELLGMTLHDIDPDLTWECWLEGWRNLKIRCSHTFECRYRAKDGRIFPVEINANYFEFNNQPYEAVFARDITEQKKSFLINESRIHLMEFAADHSLNQLLEETLNEAENLTESAIGFYNFVDDNQQSVNFLSWSSKTKAMCIANGKELHYNINEAGVWVDCVRQKKPVIHNDYASLPYRKGLPQGHIPLVRELVVPVIRGGTIKAILAVGNKPNHYTENDVEAISLLADVTWETIERKRAEEALIEKTIELDRYFTNALDLLCIADTDGYFRRLNPEWESTLGFSLAELEGRRFLDLVHPDDMEGTLNILSQLTEQKEILNFINRYKCKDGSYRWIEWRSFPYGNLIYAVARDVTKQKTMEKELFTAKKMEIIGQLAGGVAHEVRNPLNAILSISEALFKEKGITDNPEYQPYIEHIRNQVSRLSKLMTDLLDLGKPIKQADVQPFQVDNLCANAIEFWRSSPNASDHPVEFRCALNAQGEKVLVDINRFQQVIFNILDNAAQNSPEGSKILLSVERSGEQNLSIKVIDKGKGIDPGKLDRVFEPFFTMRNKGIGLGLALVKYFMEGMGGEIRLINNDPPPGCTTELILNKA